MVAKTVEDITQVAFTIQQSETKNKKPRNQEQRTKNKKPRTTF